MPIRRLSSALFLLTVPVLAGNDTLGVPGSTVRFPVQITQSFGHGPVPLRLTGAALRKKFFFNVYAMSSYLAEGVEVHSPAQLAAIDKPKSLQLVMERSVDGSTMASAVTASVRANYPKGLDRELHQLQQFMIATPVAYRDVVWLRHLPGKGFHCEIVGKGEVYIPSTAFSKAIWDIYLGPINMGEHIKAGLVRRL